VYKLAAPVKQVDQVETLAHYDARCLQVCANIEASAAREARHDAALHTQATKGLCVYCFTLTTHCTYVELKKFIN